MTVAAVVEEAGGEFALQDVEVGELRPGEVLIDLRASGVCHTDLGARAGAYPTPRQRLSHPAAVRARHEGAGVISAVAPGVHDLAVGDRQFPIDRLVSTFRFDEINDAVAAMESGQVIKSVILFD